ncbi:hypothetical protein Godav_006739 [Gossypium davidsonii]|uniref:Uncharacterized protein n=1 Tax=Gossypium davidsonii TaxID=34287 RepID=A0A7J8S4P2_GOSDV|nr:hypothetical protein [Gossypium davidsonii]
MTLVLQNLSPFLTDSLNLKLEETTTIVNIQEGLRNMLQICVALCIDAYLGYRWMLILSSLLYSAGLFLLALSVPSGEGCPSNCFKELKHTSFWKGLTLVVVGGAAQVIPLYALSFEQTKVAKSPEDCEPARVQVGCFRLLNSAAVKESPADDNLRTRWRLCTVTEVEQTKLLLDIIPMSATFIVYGMVKSLGNTFFIEQADTMHGGTPLVLLQLIQLISKSAVNKGYKMVLGKRIQRIKDALKKKGLLDNPEAKAPMSASWLLLQFIFLGAIEGLAGDGILNFFGHYVPDSRRYAPVFTSSLTGFGTILSIGFIAIIDYYSRFRFKESWIGESVNESRLDLIYRAYVMLAVLNCFIYAYVASSYSYDNIIGRPENEQEIPVLEVQQQQETAAGDQQNK